MYAAPHLQKGITLSFSIAIVGASGLVGSALSAHILRSGLLEPKDCLQLIGHGEAGSTGRLLAIRADLLDAFDELRVDIDVLDDIDAANADVVVVAAGVAMPSGCTDRREMGRANLPIFRRLAKRCSHHLPNATYLVVSNPVELAVQELVRQIDRKRVIGIGAEQDSLRFARSLARSLGISRHDVHASVWGEHGGGMVPVWNSVRLRSQDETKHMQLAELKRSAEHAPRSERVTRLQDSVVEFLQRGDIAAAYHLVEAALPDARIFVEPFVTASALHSTPNATANAVLNFIRAWKEEDGRCVHAQVQLEGEFHGIVGPFGIPISITQDGWSLHSDAYATEWDREAMAASSQAIHATLAAASCLQDDLQKDSLRQASELVA